MRGHEYRDLVAGYLDRNFGAHGLLIYTEVEVGKSIIGKRRKLDVFVRAKSSGAALGIECKYQNTSGTTDEKIPYALQDLAAMWIPGCLVYSGEGWSRGVLQMLEGSKLAAHCTPNSSLARTRTTLELDHVIAATFGLWNAVVPERRRFSLQRELDLPEGQLARSAADGPSEKKSGAK